MLHPGIVGMRGSNSYDRTTTAMHEYRLRPGPASSSNAEEPPSLPPPPIHPPKLPFPPLVPPFLPSLVKWCWNWHDSPLKNDRFFHQKRQVPSGHLDFTKFSSAAFNLTTARLAVAAGTLPPRIFVCPDFRCLSLHPLLPTAMPICRWIPITLLIALRVKANLGVHFGSRPKVTNYERVVRKRHLAHCS